jgi:hypothetical protein
MPCGWKTCVRSKLGPCAHRSDFIGWTSTSANITDAVIASDGSQGFNFAIDDFTFDAVQPSSTVPEPASVALLATGLLGVAGFARRRRRSMK